MTAINFPSFSSTLLVEPVATSFIVVVTRPGLYTSDQLLGYLNSVSFLSSSRDAPGSSIFFPVSSMTRF
jgi:hypothetical protein